MTVTLDGSPASEGIAAGKVFLLDWGVPVVPHVTVDASQVDAEVERFHEARAWAGERLIDLQGTAGVADRFIEFTLRCQRSAQAGVRINMIGI